MRSWRWAVWLAMLVVSGRAWGDEPTGSVRPWGDYKVILWISDTAYAKPERVPAFWQSAKAMGVNTGMVHHEGHEGEMGGMPYYVENIVNKGLCLKWNSQVRDWDKMVTAWAKGGRGEAGMVREYCLDDPAYLAWAKGEMERVARKNAASKPVAYDIRDELSVTMSANPFDYDMGEKSLAGFREWLKGEYGDVKTLNAQWGTAFGSWGEVRPFTTDQIKNRMGGGVADGKGFPRGKPDWQAVQHVKFEPVAAQKDPGRWNLSPWCDFRTYMDISLSRTLGDIRVAARAVDPATPVGIEGTQMPSAWGGYDLWRMSRVLDWVEAYDIGNAHAIWGSFMPGRPILTTVGESEPKAARRRLWHLLLEGDKGCIVWWSEDCVDVKTEGCPLTAKGKALAPVLKEMTGPVAALFMRARKEFDPIYVGYSQPSIQADWLIESTVDGSTWLRRFSSYEAQVNRQAKVRNSWLKTMEDLGYSVRFISSTEIEAGKLAQDGARVLVLPCAWAMTDKELAAVERYAGAGGTVLCDGKPGLFDGRGKLRGAPANADGTWERMFSPAASWECVYAGKGPEAAQRRDGDVAGYGKARLTGDGDGKWLGWVAGMLPVKPAVQVRVAGPDTDIGGPRVRVHRFALGDAELLAFERNVDYQMGEDLKQAGGNAALEVPLEVVATFTGDATGRVVYELPSGKELCRLGSIRFTLDPWMPALFVVTKQEVRGDVLTWLSGQGTK